MIETREFGNTGHESTRTLFGAAALGSVSQDEADKTLEVLLHYGVNHIDVAASYGKGEAEKRLAPWFPEHRERFFLATKTGMRSYDEAKADFHGSLERMGIEKVDLIQLHNLVEDDHWAEAMGPKGALKAVVEARDEGLVDYIGVTGHGFSAPRSHMRSIREFEFTSVLLPYNWLLMQEEGYRRDFEELVALCVERNVAIQTIKSIARRPWQGERRRTCWYEPLEEQADIDTAVAWALGNPHVFLNTVGDVHVLPKVLEAASKADSRPSNEDMAALAGKTDMELIFEGHTALSSR